MRPALFRSSLILCLALVLGACGFQLRGAVKLPYQNIYIALPETSVLGTELRRQIKANQSTVLVDNSRNADAVFRPLDEKRERIIASLTARGQAREYQLRLRYTFRVENGKGQPLTPVNEIVMNRDVTYDDNQVLSKQQEEEFLWQSMQKELAQQILRRLAAVQPRLKTDEEEDY